MAEKVTKECIRKKYHLSIESKVEDFNERTEYNTYIHLTDKELTELINKIVDYDLSLPI